LLTARLKQGLQFESAFDDDLLTAGLKAGVYLEHSCRNGRCNSCKALLLEGETEELRPQTGLTAEEIAQGFILSCCHRAKTDVLLDAECLDVPPIKSSVRPCKIDFLAFSGDVALLTLRLPPTERFEFYPGQYVQLAKGTSAPRSYSIANAPRVDGKLEFHIKQQPGGLFSDYLFKLAKPGDMLKLVGPQGSFFFRAGKPARHLIFLATGTGLAPCKAILEGLAAQSSEPREAWLYWGNRHAADFYWQPELMQNFTLHQTNVASREQAWSGAHGHVQQHLMQDFPQAGELAVYACGSEAMIREARSTLIASGLPADRFFSDAFVASN